MWTANTLIKLDGRKGLSKTSHGINATLSFMSRCPSYFQIMHSIKYIIDTALLRKKLNAVRVKSLLD